MSCQTVASRGRERAALRDIGGYSAPDGHTTRSGRMFRCSTALAVAACDRAADEAPLSVLDLRTAEEVAGAETCPALTGSLYRLPLADPAPVS